VILNRLAREQIKDPFRSACLQEIWRVALPQTSQCGVLAPGQPFLRAQHDRAGGWRYAQCRTDEDSFPGQEGTPLHRSREAPASSAWIFILQIPTEQP